MRKPWALPGAAFYAVETCSQANVAGDNTWGTLCPSWPWAGLGGAGWGVGGDPWEGALVMCFACPDSGQDRFAGQLECLAPGDFLPSVVCLIK